MGCCDDVGEEVEAGVREMEDPRWVSCFHFFILYPF